MPQSYLTIKGILQQFIDKHKALQGRGAITDYDQINNFSIEGTRFPLMYGSISDVSMDENADVYTFRFYCLDLLQDDGLNEPTVKNHTLLILRDFVNWLKYDLANGIKVLSNRPRAIPVTNFLMDRTSGWYIDVSFETTTILSDCVIPFTDTPQYSGVTCNVQYVMPFLTCETLQYCQTIINIQDELANLTGLTGTLIQNGLNTYTGGTSALPTVNVSAATLNYLSATSISGGTIYSGQTNLSSLFAPFNVVGYVPYTGANQAVNLNTQDLIAGSISGQTSSILTTGSLASSFVRNLDSTGQSRFRLNLDNSVLAGASFTLLNTAFPASGINVPRGAYLQALNLNTLTLQNTSGTGTIDFATGGATLRATISAAGTFGILNLSGTSMSGGTIYSGSTNLYDIFLQTSQSGGTSTLVQPGLNTYTGGTSALPTVNVSAATLTYLSATSISGTNIYSGTNNLSNVFAPINTVGYIPYTGATRDVDLGSHVLNAGPAGFTYVQAVTSGSSAVFYAQSTSPAGFAQYILRNDINTNRTNLITYNNSFPASNYSIPNGTYLESNCPELALVNYGGNPIKFIISGSSILTAQTIQANGQTSFNGNQIKNLAPGTGATDAVNYSQLTGATSGGTVSLAPTQIAFGSSTSTVTSSPLFFVDIPNGSLNVNFPSIYFYDASSTSWFATGINGLTLTQVDNVGGRFRIRPNFFETVRFSIYGSIFSNSNSVVTADASANVDIKGSIASSGSLRIQSGITNNALSGVTVDGLINYDGQNLFGYLEGSWQQLNKQIISASFSQTVVAATVLTVTGFTQSNNTYRVNVTPTNALSAAVFYVTNKTNTTFDVTYLAGLTGTVGFDWSLTNN